MRQGKPTITFFLLVLCFLAQAQDSIPLAIVKNVADGPFAYPSFHARHNYYVAQQRQGNFLQLFRIHPGQPVQQLTFDSAQHSHPCLSNNGEWLAYTKEINGARDIWLLNLSTGVHTNLTATPAHSESHPLWGPADSLLLFNTNRFDSLQEIASIRPADKTVKRLTANKEEDTYGSLSPDGKKLVYTKWLNEEKNPEIYVLSVSDGLETRVTANALRDVSPVWVSDSVIVFTQNGSIIVHNLVTQSEKRLTTDSGFLFVRPVPIGNGLLLCERLKDRRPDGLSIIRF